MSANIVRVLMSSSHEQTSLLQKVLARLSFLQTKAEGASQYCGSGARHVPELLHSGGLRRSRDRSRTPAHEVSRDGPIQCNRATHAALPQCTAIPSDSLPRRTTGYVHSQHAVGAARCHCLASFGRTRCRVRLDPVIPRALRVAVKRRRLVRKRPQVESRTWTRGRQAVHRNFRPPQHA